MCSVSVRLLARASVAGLTFTIAAAPSSLAAQVGKVTYFSSATAIGPTNGGDGYRSATARAVRLGTDAEASASGAEGKVRARVTTDSEGNGTCGWYEASCVRGGSASAVFRDVATMRFTWDLPEGATYTSASGVFMSAAAPATTAAPEPATWLLLGAGLAALAGARRLARVPDAA